ncbi:ClpP/crotonase [Rozella allomycis CSF55]|uniref:ClpP/crotonase n=1 Tax=Rozella allomycis (strain CSF55) TaxID=988480 RepID=A0A4P9YK44_ROZAC|nr:ClpP/crotonase [Rozella allomycis CSF55]
MKVNFPSSGDAYLRLEKREEIFILHLCNSDNRFNRISAKAWNDALDLVEEHSSKNPRTALITINENGKIFSNGLDLFSLIETNDSTFIGEQYLPLLYRVLVFPVPTIAVIRGHAFAGGCLIALAHDYRIMKKDRGFMCMNEVELPSPLSLLMSSVIRLKFNGTKEWRECALRAKRYNAEEGVRHGIVDIATSDDDVLKEAIKMAKALMDLAEKSGKVYGLLKQSLYYEAREALDKEKGLVFNMANTLILVIDAKNRSNKRRSVGLMQGKMILVLEDRLEISNESYIESLDHTIRYLRKYADLALNIKILSIISTDITEIPFDLFPLLPNLTKLVIEKSVIHSLQLQRWPQWLAKQLTKLHIYDSEISSLTNELVSVFENLTELSLIGNKISGHVEIESQTLLFLNLSGNSIENLNLQSNSLKALAAESNKLKSLDCNTKELIALSLKDNHLANGSLDCFKNCHSLSFVDLEKNLFTDIDKFLLLMDDLSTLNMRSNPVTFIPGEVIFQATFLNIKVDHLDFAKDKVAMRKFDLVPSLKEISYLQLNLNVNQVKYIPETAINMECTDCSLCASKCVFEESVNRLYEVADDCYFPIRFSLCSHCKRWLTLNSQSNGCATENPILNSLLFQRMTNNGRINSIGKLLFMKSALKWLLGDNPVMKIEEYEELTLQHYRPIFDEFLLPNLDD